MESEEFVRKVHMSEIVGPSSRERPLGRWKDRVKEYMCERGATREGRLNKQGGSANGVNCGVVEFVKKKYIEAV